MFHLVAWYESIDPGGTWANIAGVPDQTVTVNGDNVYVPTALPNMIGAACLFNDTTATLGGRVTSPSLRTLLNPDVNPIVSALVWGSPPEGNLHPLNANPLKPTEGLQFQINANPASAAVGQGFVWLSDGPQQAVSGDIRTVRATGAASLSAGAWVNTALTFSETLPAGTYNVVGMRAIGTHLVAARVSFVGSAWRPGVLAVNATGDLDDPLMRFGRLGVFGQFDQVTPPTVDCFGVTDTAQTFFFDLIQTG